MSSSMTERRETIAKFVTERGTVTFAKLKKTFPRCIGDVDPNRPEAAR